MEMEDKMVLLHDRLEIAFGRHQGAQARSISTIDMELGSPH
jgi:hypothetical protein